jgi:hemerythrin
MEYIKWKEEMSVGLDSIDAQHKELFRLINAFYNRIVEKVGKSAILQAIVDLENYTLIHFNEEERLMKAASYPYLTEHQKEHQQFIETVANFRKRYEGGRLLLSLEVTGFVKQWITDHIMKTDQLYKSKINEIPS